MEILQTFWKHILKVGGVNRSRKNESFTVSQEELRMFMESLNYNPMMNHLILSKVFRFSSQNDLLRFRLVCKSWHEQATLYLLVKDPIHRVVTREADLAKLLNLSRNSDYFPIQSFYIKIPSLTTPPHSTLFKTLSLPCIVSLKIIIESKHFPATVKTISLYMKTLKHLVICRVPEQSFEALGYTSAPGGANTSSFPGKLPCLLSLILRNAKPTRNFLSTYDGAVMELLRASNLQTLEFHYWGLLTRILREGNLSGVRNLRIIGSRLSQMDITMLIEKRGLMLDKFSAKVDKYVSPKLIQELLDKKVQGTNK